MSHPTDELLIKKLVSTRESLARALEQICPIEGTRRRHTNVAFSTLLLDWLSLDTKRILTVHLLEADEPFKLDFFFKTHDGGERELCVRLQNPLTDIQLVVFCLELWILNGFQQDLESRIENHLQSLSS